MKLTTASFAALALAVGAADVADAQQRARGLIGKDHVAKSERAKVLVMDPNVQVTFFTTGGPQKRADWSEEAEKNLLAALTQQLEQSGETLIMVPKAVDETPEVQQALLLNEAVSSALGMGGFVAFLPHSKEQKETFTLGESVKALANGSDADYALFLTSSSTIESGGVFLTSVLIGAATGYVPVSQNFRGSYVSLVDLSTGEVVWYNTHFGGDPRNPAEAASQITNILKGGPLSDAVRTPAKAK